VTQGTDGSPNLLDEAPQRIAAVRALNGLGDLLCAIPALRALRGFFPDAHVTLIGMPAAREFVARFHRYVDDIIEFPGWPGIVERPRAAQEVEGFLEQAREQRFDLAVQMHGSGQAINDFVLALGARHTAGFFLEGQPCPDAATFLPYPVSAPEPLRHLRLMEFLGVPPAGEALEWPLTAADRAELGAVPDLATLPAGSFTCVHAGARDPLRRWPAERFAAAADWLAAQGVVPVLTGTDEERPLVEAMSKHMQAAYVDACGRLTLGALGVLLTRARLLLSNDTGVSHLAAALRVPSVVVFSGSDRARWAPLDGELHRAVGMGVPDEAEVRVPSTLASLDEVAAAMESMLALGARSAQRAAPLRGGSERRIEAS
jgi:ADP-heptose:LPS heptosyltransferase